MICKSKSRNKMCTKSDRLLGTLEEKFWVPYFCFERRLYQRLWKSPCNALTYNQQRTGVQPVLSPPVYWDPLCWQTFAIIASAFWKCAHRATERINTPMVPHKCVNCGCPPASWPNPRMFPGTPFPWVNCAWTQLIIGASGSPIRVWGASRKAGTSGIHHFLPANVMILGIT